MTLPTSMASQTVSIQPLTPPPIPDTTPAIRALESAFKQGVVDFDTINSHFTKGKVDAATWQKADEEIQASKDRMAGAPEQKKLDDAKRAAELAKLEDDEFLRLPTRESALRKLEREKSSLTHDEIEGLRVIAKSNPQAVAAFFAARLKGAAPAAPAPATNEALFAPTEPMTVPLDDIKPAAPAAPADPNDILVRALDSVPAAQPEITPAQTTAIEEANKLGIGSTMFDAAGNPKPFAMMQVDLEAARKRLAEAPKVLTPAQQLEEEQSVVAAEALLQKFEAAKKLVFSVDPKGAIKHGPDGSPEESALNPVGPVIGMKYNPWPWAKAAAGLPEQRNAQDQLTMLINDLTREKTQALKGALSNKELQFLQDSIVKLNSGEATWEVFLRDSTDLLTKALEARKKAVGQGSTAAPAPTTGSEETKRMLIRTRAEYDAMIADKNIPSGTPLIDATGKPGWKP